MQIWKLHMLCQTYYTCHTLTLSEAAGVAVHVQVQEPPLNEHWFWNDIQHMCPIEPQVSPKGKL